MGESGGMAPIIRVRVHIYYLLPCRHWHPSHPDLVFLSVMTPTITRRISFSTVNCRPKLCSEDSLVFPVSAAQQIKFRNLLTARISEALSLLISTYTTCGSISTVDRSSMPPRVWKQDNRSVLKLTSVLDSLYWNS